MATGGKERCGALCQHPGCWQATKKVYKTPAGYLSKIEISKKMYQSGRIPTPVDSQRNSYTADGLPTLKVNTLGCDGIHEHKCPKTYPHTLVLPSLAGAAKAKQVQSPFRAPEIHHVQFLLEDDDDDYSSLVNKPMEVTYTPVLLWKPGRQKRHSQQIAKSTATSLTLDKVPREHYLSEARSLSRKPTPAPASYPEFCRSPATPTLHTRVGEAQGRRSPLVVCRTDLTNALPPSKASLQSRVRTFVL